MKIHSENNQTYLELTNDDGDSSWREIFQNVSEQTGCGYDFLVEEFFKKQGISSFSELNVYLGQVARIPLPASVHDTYVNFQQQNRVLEEEENFRVNALFRDKPSHTKIITRDQFIMLNDLLESYEVEYPNENILHNQHILDELLTTVFLEAERKGEGFETGDLDVLLQNFDDKIFEEWFLYFEENPQAKGMLTTREFHPLPYELTQNLKDYNVIEFNEDTRFWVDTDYEIDDKVKECESTDGYFMEAEFPESRFVEGYQPIKSALDLYRITDDGLTMEIILENENVSSPEVLEKAKQGLQSLENQWFEKYHSIPVASLSDRELKEKILEICDAAKWYLTGKRPEAFLNSLTRKDLEFLYLASELKRFYDDLGFDYRATASVSEIMVNRNYDCNTISILTMHLFQMVGLEDWMYLSIPQHGTLVYKTEDGSEVYFDNSQTFFPEGFYQIPNETGVYTRMGSETFGEMGESLGAYQQDGNYYSPFLFSGDFENAEEFKYQMIEEYEEFKNFNTLSPNYVPNYTTLGEYAFFLSNIDSLSDEEKEMYKNEAIKYFEQGIRINDANADLYYFYAEFLFGCEKFDEGFSKLEKIIEIQVSYFLDHETQPFIDRILASERYEKNPDDPKLNYYIGRLNGIHTNYNSQKKAERYLRIAYQQDFDDEKIKKAYSDNLVDHALIRLEYNQVSWAKEYLDKALEIDNENPSVYVGLAILSWEKGDQKKYLEYYQKAMALDPDNSEYKAIVADWLKFTDSEYSIQLIDEAYAQTPYDANIIYQKYERSLEVGDLAEAELQLDAILQRTWGSHYIRSKKALLDAVNGDFEQAEKNIDGILAVERNFAAYTGQRTNAKNSIIRTYEMALADVLWTKGDYDRCYNIYKNAYRYDRNNFAIIQILFRISIDQGKGYEAYLEKIRLAISDEKTAERNKLALSLSLAYYELFIGGDLEKAKEYIDKCYEKRPDILLVKTYKLCSEIVQDPKFTEEGYVSNELKELQQITDDHPRDFESRWLLGNLYERVLGDSENALLYYKSAYELQPENKILERKISELDINE